MCGDHDAEDHVDEEGKKFSVRALMKDRLYSRLWSSNDASAE